MAVYGGLLSDHEITFEDGRTVVRDRTAWLGAEGRDVLVDVEKIRFADHVVFLDGRNNAPVPNLDLLSTREDRRLVIDPSDLLSNDRDVDGDPLALVSVEAASNGRVSLAADGAVVFRPDRDFDGLATFTYVVADEAGGEATGTAAVRVRPVNDRPFAVDDTATVDEDDPPVLIDVLANDGDVDGDPLEIVSVDGATGSVSVVEDAFGAGRPGLSYAPAPNFNGDDGFTYTVDDGNGDRAVAAVTIDVQPVADPPVITLPQDFIVQEDMTITLSATVDVFDASDGILPASVRVSGLPAGTVLTDGTETETVAPGDLVDVDVTDWDLGGLALTPPPDSSADVTVTLTAEASDAATGRTTAGTTASVTVTVEPVPDRPTIGTMTVTGAEDTAIDLPPPIPGAASETVRVTALVGVPEGAVVAWQVTDDSRMEEIADRPDDVIAVAPSAAGPFTITPPADFFGSFGVTMRTEVTDTDPDDGGTATETFDLPLEVAVTPVLDAPTIEGFTVDTGNRGDGRKADRTPTFFGTVDAASSDDLRLILEPDGGEAVTYGLDFEQDLPTWEATLPFTGELAPGRYTVVAEASNDGQILRSDAFAFEIVSETAIRIGSMTAADGFVLEGPAGSAAGFSVSGTGDVDGDGLADVIVGGPGTDGTNRTDAGAAWIVYGAGTGEGPEPRSIQLPPSGAFDGGIALAGPEAGARAGASVSGGKDIDGDGRDDAVLGAPGVVITDGGDGALFGLYGFAGSGRPGAFDLSDPLDGAGFRIDGLRIGSGDNQRPVGDGLGTHVAAVGDFFDRGGIEDVAVSTAARVQVLPGRADDEPRAAGTFNDPVPTGDDIPVADAGDFNGDGIGEIVWGDAEADRVDVVFNLRPVFGQVMRFDGMTAVAVDGAGDVNADGFDDVVIGISETENGQTRGEAFVVFGRPGDGSNDFQSIDLAAIDPAAGFRIAGAADGERFGASVAGAGDVNGDGFDDVIIGAPGAGDGGRAYVVFGGATGPWPSLDSGLSLEDGVIIAGETGSPIGGAVDGAGDVDRDGFDDVVIGAPDVDKAFVIRGGSGFGPDAPQAIDAGRLVGTSGDDVLSLEDAVVSAPSGEGPDQVVRGGAGDDEIRVLAGNRVDVDGGTGTDTLVLVGPEATGTIGTVDLTSLGDEVLRDIEAIRLADPGTLVLGVTDVLALSGTPHGDFSAFDVPRRFVIDGGPDNTLELDARGNYGWERTEQGVDLSGAAGGDHDLWVARLGDEIVAALAIDADIAVI